MVIVGVWEVVGRSIGWDESQGRWLKEGTIFMYCSMDVFVSIYLRCISGIVCLGSRVVVVGGGMT